MNELRLLKRRFILRFTAETALPPFIGNTIRGALGSALDRMGSPAYGAVFKIDSAKSAPNPYAISTPYPSAGRYKAGDELAFSVTLFGNACVFDDEITVAARNMCHGKLADCVFAGDELVYDRAWNDAGAKSIPRCESVAIRFLSPTEFLRADKPVREIDFGMFIDNLFGRICDIMGNYTDEEFVLPYALIERRPFVAAEYDLTPVAFKTGSQPVYGMTGKVKYTGDVTRFLPYIDLGSQIQVGKKTTRGCGVYRFET